ncbi:hypothetical protein AB434_1792 [Heyndrickxia coagulans]|uniref:Uncharacterized protein n=1 Tax=Heyndrickxia coagulans TaxID=1398 RepID=A0AAN0TAN2_HEYCO|nr:hypothetical protein SB48_HM08orf05650 [Heyndrickxia coagulans]AKN54197.1 hypothetical protein AB434_1792 [Heyndrickxia coagulans]
MWHNFLSEPVSKRESLHPKEASLFPFIYSLLGSPVKRLSLFL